MGNRNHYLPRKTRLDAMSDHDRATLLGDKLVELANEIVGLKHGEITAWKGGKAYQLKLSRDRLRRLRKAANDYGLWLHENDEANALPKISLSARGQRLVSEFIESRQARIRDVVAA